jgi:CelD/BcsL family acetyltransferase involved in cellulose biosynthesis
MLLKESTPAECCQAVIPTATRLTAEIRRGGAELVEQLAPQWRELCADARMDEPFYRPEWVAAYLRAFRPHDTLLLPAAYEDGRLRAVLPLVKQTNLFCGIPVRMLQGAANVHSCRFDLLCSAGELGQAAVQRLWEVLREERDWDVIELPYVPEGAAAEWMLDAARQDGFPVGSWESQRSAYVHLNGIADATEIPRDAHFRQNLRRRLRKAQSRWTVRLTRTETDDPQALLQFYKLERAGWKGKEKTAIACSDETRHFYDEIARTASQFGYFTLYLLHFNDEVVAGHFGLTYRGKRYYSPKVAYDEAYASYGPGHLIVEAILREVIAKGCSEFDFLGGWMEWKGEWARVSRSHSSHYIFRRGAFGNALYSLKFKLLQRLRPVVRQMRNMGR